MFSLISERKLGDRRRFTLENTVDLADAYLFQWQVTVGHRG
jgi:hypothetical protein